MLSYIAECAGSSQSGIEHKVLNTNPVLEAMGNAKTSRNNNSSRFGKWIEVLFNGNLSIVGANITEYLLETTRVITQNKTERGFHVFYYLIYAEKFGLGGSPNDYACLANSSVKAEGINDLEEYEAMCNALTDLGWTQQESDDLFSIV